MNNSQKDLKYKEIKNQKLINTFISLSKKILKKYKKPISDRNIVKKIVEEELTNNIINRNKYDKEIEIPKKE